jgi:MoaA/NifB/PqqE/SkfB family radical SAM enzyme
MLDTVNFLFPGTFPPLRHERPGTLLVILSYLCNQQCQHCHVNAGPSRV